MDLQLLLDKPTLILIFFRYTKGSEAGHVSKKDIANLIRKRRKIGDDLPPIYPNGWFRLLDSHQLNLGEVKEVCAMGE